MKSETLSPDTNERSDKTHDIDGCTMLSGVLETIGDSHNPFKNLEGKGRSLNSLKSTC